MTLRKYMIVINLWLMAWIQSCTPPVLNAHTDYVSVQNLASYWIDTPDPQLNNPPYGQRLFIDWAIPQEWREMSDKIIRTTIRFRDGSDFAFEFAVEENRGSYTYLLLNEQYSEKRGILSYKVELWSGATLLSEWRHQVWAERFCLSD